MNTTKHTPGPWTVAPSARASTLTRIFSEDEGRLIASANGPGLSESGEAEANARLIAAAPELLAACQEIIEGMVDGKNSTNKNVTMYAIQMVKSAIAKATTI